MVILRERQSNYITLYNMKIFISFIWMCQNIQRKSGVLVQPTKPSCAYS